MRRCGFALFLLLSISIITLSACGGGGGGSEAVTPPTISLLGTYNLTGFDIDFYDGLFYMGSLAETDFSSWSGEMKIGLTTFNQSFVLEGVVGGTSGTYVITYTSGTSVGYATVNDGGTIYTIGFSITGNNITTFTSGYDPVLGWDWEEWDYWVKTSDSLGGSITSLSIESDKLGSPVLGFANLIDWN